MLARPSPIANKRWIGDVAMAGDTYMFVLVHGGCHDGSAWRPVIEHLEHLGHTAYGPTVAGHGKGGSLSIENELVKWIWRLHPFGQGSLPGPTQFVDRRLPTRHCHQERFSGAADFGTAAVVPADVGRV